MLDRCACSNAATLEDFDQTEEAHHAADVAHQEAMDFVVQAENRKLAAVQARDEALEYLRATVLSRCPRTEKTRILAEEGWGEAVAFLQARGGLLAGLADTRR